MREVVHIHLLICELIELPAQIHSALSGIFYIHTTSRLSGGQRIHGPGEASDRREWCSLSPHE